MVMSDLKQIAALTALNAMFRKKWFDICAVDAVAKMLGRDPDCDAYRTLRTLHCVHFADMPKELRDAIPKLVAQCLDTEPVFQFALPAPPLPPAPPPKPVIREDTPGRNNFFRRLFR